jgi:mannose-1-phosphate guanylyltransferase
MKAMILAAGLGTRLRPLTDDRPKALVEVAGRTMLEITLCRLRSFGVREVIVNTHHYADMIVDYLHASGNFGMRIEVSREQVLLDTGGGLKNAAWFFLDPGGSLQEPFILHNVDVISTIDLNRMMRFHTEHNALATLAVQDRETSRYLLFDEQGLLCGRRVGRTARAEAANAGAASVDDGQDELVRPAQKLQALAFSGVHVISPHLFAKMRDDGAFSIIDAYLHLAAQGEKIVAFRADEYAWRDLGRPESVMQAACELDSEM